MTYCIKKDRCNLTLQFTITKASPKDRKAVLDLSLNFPGDYLEETVDRWTCQKEGGLFLAWHDDTLVGCCALSYPSPLEGWLHGMRVHPDYQGQGLAFKLNSYLINQAESSGATVIRLLTAPDNHGAIKVSTRLGLKDTGFRPEVIFRESSSKDKKLTGEKGSPLQLCSHSDLPAVNDLIFSTPAIQTSGKLLFMPGYSYRSLTGDYLARAVNNNELYLIKYRDHLQGLMVTVKNKEDRHLVISYLQAPPEMLPSVTSMIPVWTEQGFLSFSFSLSREQHHTLHPSLKYLFGPYDYHHWQLMEKELIKN